ncbi:MAG TPA: NAD(P)/FAD-dependent oxidoreductase, partial [Vicinamibacterales bacterium]|nr:NAD(P)/FAD-dependent oxidoreductase [Vicinamibacterales bacterium]
LVAAASDPLPVGAGVTAAGGPGALAAAMASAARDAGAEIRTGAEVARILVDDARARGVQLASGETIAADVVLSNADPKRTLLDLVDPGDLEPAFRWKIRHYRTRGTTSKVNLALSAPPAFDGSAFADAAAASRLLLAPGIDHLERAFDAAKYGRIPEEPWLEAAVPTHLDPSLAPPGAHVMSILVHFTPYDLRGDDWQTARERLGDLVVERLARYIPRLPSLVVARQVLTPLDLERTYGLTGGQIHHGEPALDQMFFMRPLYGWSRHRTPVRGLYLCGSGVHPGWGLTGAAGLSAAREVIRDGRKSA